MTAVAVTAGSSAHLAPRSVARSEFISSSVTELLSVFVQINLRSLSIDVARIIRTGEDGHVWLEGNFVSYERSKIGCSK